MSPSTPSAAVDAASPPIAAPQVAVIGAAPHQRDLVDWALGRFASAELPLPDVTIEFHPTVAGCRGYVGYFDQASHKLDMCDGGDQRITPANTILHELAHAWSFEYMAASARDEFVAHRDLASWDEADIWWHMGQEQAAEIIAWGLMEESFRSIYARWERCVDLAAAFELLTTQAPLHNDAEYCEA
jgi:hypothetical protein